MVKWSECEKNDISPQEKSVQWKIADNLNETA